MTIDVSAVNLDERRLTIEGTAQWQHDCPDIDVTTGASITGTNNLLNYDPLLGPLANNGGPTLTHLPQSNSPCINTGTNPNNLVNDQRGPGFPRIQGLTDIGAVELPSLQPSPFRAVRNSARLV